MDIIAAVVVLTILFIFLSIYIGVAFIFGMLILGIVCLAGLVVWGCDRWTRRIRRKRRGL